MSSEILARTASSWAPNARKFLLSLHAKAHFDGVAMSLAAATALCAYSKPRCASSRTLCPREFTLAAFFPALVGNSFLATTGSDLSKIMAREAAPVILLLLHAARRAHPSSAPRALQLRVRRAESRLLRSTSGVSARAGSRRSCAFSGQCARVQVVLRRGLFGRVVSA